jgi:hypothetical protein
MARWWAGWIGKNLLLCVLLVPARLAHAHHDIMASSKEEEMHIIIMATSSTLITLISEHLLLISYILQAD